jgi:hypothetical protein
LSCPQCHESARFVAYRPKTFQSLMGTMRLDRAYYHCARCSLGTIPWDEALRLGHGALTPAAAEVVSLAGVIDSFAEASTVVLCKMSGLRVSESTVERTSEAVGADIGQRLADGETFGPGTPWAWHKDAAGKTCAYVSLDLTGVGQQGPKGTAAEGRMVAVGMIYNPVPEDPACWARPTGRRPHFQARYLATLDGQAALAEPLRRQAAQVGMDQAQRWIALSDGGAGLEDLLAVSFGRLDAVILDFYHASEHLGDLARALYPGQEEPRTAWLERWCSRLKHEGGAAVLEALRSLPLPDREPVCQTHQEVTRYFENQVHRMDYPSYLAQGWAIGSGPVESACKTIIGQRLKGGGMRWGEDGADAMSHLRALFKSGDHQWDAYWHPCLN